MKEDGVSTWPIAFALIYFTFFLDNVLLTVLVPIIPDWVRGESLTMWATYDAPLAAVLNSTVHQITQQDKLGAGVSQVCVGGVLSAKALAQLWCAQPAARAVCRRGPATVLRAGSVLLLLASAVFAACSEAAARGGGAWVWAGAGCGRAAQGAGTAFSGVAGLTLASRCVPRAHGDRALGALLGAVALGVLVGYPFGGATYALGNRAVPFLIIAAALLANLGMQQMFLDKEEFNRTSRGSAGNTGGWSSLVAAGGVGGAGGACAGAVLLTTSVMAALEPCLPLWIMDKFHPQKWVSGAVFVPDSAAYLVAAGAAGGVARALGVERVALVAQALVGVAALCVPLARSVRALAAPHVALGGGLGALDAALVPALLARRARAPHVAALLQAAAAAAYALGPLVGGALAATAGFGTAMRTLGVANLLYVAYLYRALSNEPLSPQWGAQPPDEDEEEDYGEEDDEELATVPKEERGLTGSYKTFK